MDNMAQNSVDALLLRLDIPDAINRFKEMGIDRIVVLRKLSDEDLRAAVPDDAKRKTLLEAISSRGNLQSRRGGPTGGQPHPPRAADADLMRGNFDDGFGGNNNSGCGGRGVRGVRGVRGGRGGIGEDHVRACRHHFSDEGCKYGDTCRYSHDEVHRHRVQDMQESAPPTRPNDDLAARHQFCEECVIPSDRVKFLLGIQGARMKAINEECKTFNERFDRVDETIESFTLRLYGDTPESVLRAKERVQQAVGVKKEEQQKNRFQYAVNELDANTHAAKLLIACNEKNKDTPRYLSESVLRNVISSFRFVKPQEVNHFYMNTSNSDKDKLEIVSKIVSQLKGVQAILFCDHKRVSEMSKGASRIARYFNNVEPLFLYREMSKEERMQALETFKKGTENENGVKQRLLVTNEDYAKFARKTVIPYVNLVINFSVPRTEEFYVLQSLVAGRHGTLGASFLCVTNYEEHAFRELEKSVHFEKYTDDESFRSTAVAMSYDTHADPLTPEGAEPPSDWREHLHDKKPKNNFGKRH